MEKTPPFRFLQLWKRDTKETPAEIAKHRLLNLQTETKTPAEETPAETITERYKKAA